MVLSRKEIGGMKKITGNKEMVGRGMKLVVSARIDKEVGDPGVSRHKRNERTKFGRSDGRETQSQENQRRGAGPRGYIQFSGSACKPLSSGKKTRDQGFQRNRDRRERSGSHSAMYRSRTCGISWRHRPLGTGASFPSDPGQFLRNMLHALANGRRRSP